MANESRVAVRAGLRREELLAASRSYTAELEAEVGRPDDRERESAAALARRIAAR